MVCRPSESHLEGKESERVNILVFNLHDNIVSQHEADPEFLNMHLRPVVVNKVYDTSMCSEIYPFTTGLKVFSAQRYKVS